MEGLLRRHSGHGTRGHIGGVVAVQLGRRLSGMWQLEQAEACGEQVGTGCCRRQVGVRFPNLR